MANNFTPVGSEFQVNLLTSLPETDSDIAVMTDGRFAVVYERDFGGGDIDLRLQFVDPSGATSGTTVVVEASGGAQQNASVVAFGTGALVVWQDDASSAEIHFRTVSSTGVLGTETLLLGGVAALANPDAATLADGRVLVVADRLDAGNTNLAFRFITAAGAGEGSHQSLDTGAGTQSDAAVAASGNNALVVYVDQSLGTEGVVVARMYDGSGNLPTDFTAEVQLSSGADNSDPEDPDVAALPDGRYIVVWENTDNDDIEGRFVDAAGNPIGSVFTLNAGVGGDSQDPRVAALPDGSFIVTWENDGGLFPTEDNADNFAVVARRFDKNGVPAGDLFLVNAGDPDTSQSNPAIAVNQTTGQALITWDDFHDYAAAPDDTSPPGIRGKAFNSDVDPINGTEGKDVLQGLGIGEEINGLGGKDTINAGDGDDLLNGGRGKDKLNGEAGFDIFLFDNLKGVDRLDWEDGEQLHFDSAVFKKPNQLGALKNKYFQKGTEANDGNDFFIYQKSKGYLWYDGNGDDNGKQKLVAKLDKGSDLDANEIFLV